jgi:hypothetical protein
MLDFCIYSSFYSPYNPFANYSNNLIGILELSLLVFFGCENSVKAPITKEERMA